ncbi:diguanylate cyclase [Luteimonas sp. MC1750]|uniref:diguanylate cyclase n=1 Tax=Luteimonas sp. MC1750 TaxID=2799326 RepID=UPI0018F066A2|nr:diguanylate cyclase [Luteimonas sp. MC1750]MBJ6984048.1 diguanylate cyclase [Luteimonas sp. MC1750]QQO06860.1 diguanylate cyclase [Luteimonas sp. MC1750]
MAVHPAPLPAAGHARPTAESTPDPRLAADWARRVDALSDEVRALLAVVVAEGGQVVADHFYGDMLEDPRASRYLNVDQVRERLKPSLQRWLVALLSARAGDVNALQATQEHVGQVHARIGIPVDLVARGGRMLKDDLHAGIRRHAGSEALAIEAILCANGLVDIALESMTRAYTRSREAAGQVDGAFRLFSLIQNIGTERERQRALLLTWENALIYALMSEHPGAATPLQISNSEFGLWFLHKGMASFGDTGETREVNLIAARIDSTLRARLPEALTHADRRELLDELRVGADAIRSLVSMMFDGIGDLESGRDALTRLLNRRFLPTILRREIALQANTGRQFAVLMLDLDHFKSINDTHGHEAGDRALKHVAALLVENTRGSDYLFRYGGEEFVVVLGSVSREDAVAIAEGLRNAIALAPVALADGSTLQLTGSIGVAVQDGHPDYERVLARADAAMYAAKRGGRDRVVVDDGGLPDPPGAQALRR